MTFSQPSHTTSLIINQHRYQLRHWGNPDAPLLLMLHGWMDSSASFQFLVDALPLHWHIVAPDWRGFGDSAWNRDSYYFPDYLADLDALLTQLSPPQPVCLLGHSMGAMVAGLYAGIRPERIAKLILVEGFGLPDSRPEEAPGRLAHWLIEQQRPPRFKPISSLANLAQTLQARSPQLTDARALWLAEQLTQVNAQGQRDYRADPKHKMHNPILYRLAEAQACWRQITAPVLWVHGGKPWQHAMAQGVQDTLAQRRACFAKLSEITIANAGHMVQWEQPEALAAAVAGFLA